MTRVLVAGATGPLGTAVVRQLLADGARVVAQYRSNATAATRLLGAGASGAPAADLLEPGAAERVVAQTLATLGGLDAVVNCAWPPGGSAPLADTDRADLDSGLDGLRAHHLLCRAAIPALRANGGGSIVFLGGALATRLHPGLGGYSVAKAAATTYSLTLALEEGPHGIRVNVIAPGRVDIGAGDLAEEDPGFAALDRIGVLRRSLPLPTPAEVARTAAYLASPAASGLTGQVVTVAGGEPV